MDTILLDYKEENGLVLCQGESMAKNNSEVLYIYEAKKLDMSAVLFRRHFRDGEDIPYKSEPAVCIFQKEDSFFNTVKHTELHAKLWSASETQVYIIKGNTRIDVINARKPAEFNENTHQLSIENLLLASSAIQEFDDVRFTAHLFNTGTFWEQPDFREKIDASQSPYILLLRYLLETRNHFNNVRELELLPETIDKLLITCILIKFLEERDDDNGKHTLRKIYKDNSINDFSEALDKSLSIEILTALASEFNGKIFDKFSEDEKEKIKKTKLNILVDFLRGDTNLTTKQYFIWKQYDFKYLPAEVISAIYENFIQAESVRLSGGTEKGVVYTPIHLVDFLIDESMPIDKPELFKDEDFKILDPTCGSGVFLVAAYKRLLQWWAINNRKNGNIVYPKSDVALRILENNIYGVDIKETATLVSIFGLTTALLDKLTPQQIWNNLKFSDLSAKNIRTGSFFDWAKENKEQQLKFDLVIGNPPFNPIKGLSKKEAVTDVELITFNVSNKNIPRNNFALKFFEGALFFGKNVCMIIPASILLYDKTSLEYRKRLFTNYTVKNIYDFTHLRRDLFHKTADTPVVAIVLKNQPSQGQSIEHTVVKRMLSSEKKIGFEIDYYDKHQVKWDWAVDENKFFIWKTNLLGGERLFQLIYRLSLLPTLEEFIESKKGWQQIRGFEGGEAVTLENVDQITDIAADGTPKVDQNVTIKTSNLKNDFMYSPPFVAIDQVIGKGHLSACFIPAEGHYNNKTHLYYSRDFIGISSPPEDTEILKEIYDQLLLSGTTNKLNYQLFILGTSSSSLVLTETDVNKSEILSVPYPNNTDYLSLSKTEQLIQNDVLTYSVHFGKAISEHGEGIIFEKAVEENQLIVFGENFCSVMNDIYASNGDTWQKSEFILKENYIIYPFGFGKDNHFNQSMVADFSKNDFSQLLEDNLSNRGAIFRRIIRIYQHFNGFDCVFLIKPKAQRYWLNSIALRDADDTFADLKREGY
ncbi:MAG: hypothetical protein JWP94_2986 [Mucilaginibacter sp.]|nr:hypothetical protein [Mucilaginibacter sp.]